jgi:hypothetical protein
MSRIPREAREGAMRAWLEILHQRHPGVTWIPAASDEDATRQTRKETKKQATFSG